MTCKVCYNLTHLVDRPHMQNCPRWIERGGALAYIYIYIIDIHTYVCVYMSICTNIHIYACICNYVYMYIMCMYMYMNMDMYVYKKYLSVTGGVDQKEGFGPFLKPLS